MRAPAGHIGSLWRSLCRAVCREQGGRDAMVLALLAMVLGALALQLGQGLGSGDRARGLGPTTPVAYFRS